VTIVRARSIGPTFFPIKVIGQHYVWNPGYHRWDPSTIVRYPTMSNFVFKEHTHCADETHPGPPYKVGGPLYLTRCKNPDDPVFKTGIWEIRNYAKYVGGFAFSMPGEMVIELDMVDGHTARSFGATGWNKFRPVKPKASMGQFIAELRDFPSLFKWRLKSFRDLGKNYLNYKFGWLPMLHDLRKWYETACKIEKYVEFTRKNNGKWLRRGGIIRDETTTVQLKVGNRIYPTLPTQFYGSALSPSQATRIRTTRDRIWFDSSMKFYIPELSVDSAKSVWSSRLLRKLYGLELTPALAWELLPWSWFYDWFGNIGDIIANMSNSNYDNLVAKYAYVMRHRSITDKYVQEQPLVGGEALRLDVDCVAECKEREAASPYGFGVEWPDFSASQLAILAALGVSRFPR